jgi:hypothetical protein
MFTMRYRMRRIRSTRDSREFCPHQRKRNPVPKIKRLVSDQDSDVHRFFVCALPPERASRAPYFTKAVCEAGERYDRYIARRDEWWSFAKRRDKLKKIVTFVEGVASGLRELDILSRDDLAVRVGSREIDELVASLHRLGREATILVGQAQTMGRPRDLAEERWILELADIYENAFRQSATVWGTGRPTKGRPGFYSFLELSRPNKFPSHGKLHPRQVDRLLKQRRRTRAR